MLSDTSKNVDWRYQKQIFWLSKAMWYFTEQQWLKYLKEKRLTINQYSILFILAKKKTYTITEISQLGSMHISTALNHSNKLGERGYLTLEKDTKDTRTTIATITDQGEELLQLIENEPYVNQNDLHKKLKEIELTLGFKLQFSDIKNLIYQIHGHEFFDLLD